jgi:hypothetical protein
MLPLDIYSIENETLANVRIPFSGSIAAARVWVSLPGQHHLEILNSPASESRF